MKQRALAIRLLVLAVLLGAAHVVLARASHSEPVLPRRPLSDFPVTLGAWQGGPNVPFEPKVMATLRLDDFLNREYRSTSGQSAWLYVGYHASQRTGRTAHSPLKCLPGNGWEPVEMASVDLQVADAVSPVRISRYIVQKGIDRQVIFFWYHSHGRVMWNEFATRLFMMADAFRLNRTDGALVRVLVPIARHGGNEAAAAAQGLALAREAFPHLNEFLPR